MSRSCERTAGLGTPVSPAEARSRRSVLTGVGAAGMTALLAGCQTYGESAPSDPPVAKATPPDPAGASLLASAPPDGTVGGTKALASVADIPVGGGKIFTAEQVVVTQPTAGTIRAFSAKCTHQGCTVTSVENARIVCGCHNSSFDIADGSVKAGPADRPLPTAAVTVDGESIRLA